MKKILSMLMLIFILFHSPSIIYGQANTLDVNDIYSEAAILIDGNTGEILFEKNIHKQLYPASTTKILTGILTLENVNLDEVITVDDETPYEITGTHIALEPGEEMSYKDLLNATLIESANDAAVVLAKHISGSVESFANLMNSKAKEVGAKNSNFVNPNGLPNDEHVTTAYDLAMIAKYAMENEEFRSIVKNYKYTIEPTNKKSETRYLYSSNKLLYSTENINVNGEVVDIKYDSIIGVKTGYTGDAGPTLVSAAEKDGQMLISVILKSQGNERWIDTHKLLNYGFENFDKTVLGFKNEFIKNIEIDNGDNSFVTGIIGEDASISLPKGMESQVKRSIKLDEDLEAPISKGQVLGKVEYLLDDEIIATSNIISTSDVNLTGVYKAMSDSSFLSGFNPLLLLSIPILFIVWRLVVLRSKRRKKRYVKSGLYKSKY